MLTDILNIEDKPEITIEQSGADFIFKERGSVLKFNELADGYRSILLVLSDLLKRLIENQPDVTKIEDFRGIVLIDEIDMLLHPKWEYVIVKKLREKLPKIQWFFTTHSPMLILGASDDAVFYRLYKEEGKTQISEQFTYDEIRSLRSDGVITSPLIGMEYAGMREQLENKISDIDASESWLSGRVHQQIKEKYNKRKQEGKPYTSPETINNWIKEALEKEGVE